MIKGKRLALSPQSPESFALPLSHPRLVYAREDSSGVRSSLDAGRRVLIVEDDFLIASDIEAALSEAGFAVVGVAASANEAIALATSGRPALAIVDIRLAGRRDGIDLALELLQKHALRCIFATAHFDAHARKRAEAAQPLAWVPKPYTAAQLVAAVRDVWNKIG